MNFFVFSFLVFPTWTSAINDVEHVIVHEQIKTLQSTVNELKNLVHVQSQRNDHLERLLSDNRNEVKELKDQFLNELRNLKSNFSKLDVVEANQNRFFAKLKRDGLNINRFIYSLNNRQLRLEKIHALVTEDPQELRNLSDGNNYYNVVLKEKKFENGLQSVDKIQKRLLSPHSTSGDTIAFYAFMSSILWSPWRGRVLVYDVVKSNLGNGYRSHTGVFLVPKSGVYVFTWTFRTGGKRDHSIQLMKNKEDIGSVYFQGVRGIEAGGTGVVVTHANAGDDVFTRTNPTLYIGTGYYIQSDVHGRSSFAGWKIF